MMFNTKLTIEQKTELDMLDKIYKHIKLFGINDDILRNRIGGIWGAETTRMGEMYAMLADDGATRMVGNSYVQASSTYGRAITYYNGSRDILTTLYNTMFLKEQDVPTGSYLWL